MNISKLCRATLLLALLAASGCAWNVTGNGGTNPNDNFLGTTDSQPLVIKTNNSEAMRIGATGNVGIGTTSAAEKLSVSGTIESTSGGIKFPDGTTQTTAAAFPSISVTTRTSSVPIGPTSCCGGTTATCNSDEVVTGGGFSREDDPALEMFYSRPSGNGWSASMSNYGTASRNLTVYAVCLKVQ